MTTDTATISHPDRLKSHAFAEMFRAYMEASDEVQAVIKSMARIINDADATTDEVDAALVTLHEALFPSHHDGELGIDILALRDVAPDRVQREGFAEVDESDRQFSVRLKAIMEEREVTQADLADRIGVQQPAISMMLARKCHPQRNTVERLAEALGVDPTDLWSQYQPEE